MLAIQALDIVRFVDGVDTLEGIVHADLFRRLGTLKHKYTICPKQDVVPFSLGVLHWSPIPF